MGEWVDIVSSSETISFILTEVCVLDLEKYGNHAESSLPSRYFNTASLEIQANVFAVIFGAMYTFFSYRDSKNS